jgi:CRP-like cAMP-binding protein
MPHDLIRTSLLEFRDKSKHGKDSLAKFCRESPLERTRREIQRQLREDEVYRVSILKNVATFCKFQAASPVSWTHLLSISAAGLSEESILNAARTMEECYFKQGDNIIVQDDIGDSFFVLEEGTVVVTVRNLSCVHLASHLNYFQNQRKMNPKDPTESPKELAHLKKNAHFGEIALLTADPRSATITVTSPEAKCLKMTKAKFDELLATTSSLTQENRKQIGKDVLDTVPLFKSLSSINKKKLLEAMMPMTYLPGSYICRQGTTGNAFFILTDGTCKVTINMSESAEREVAKLHPGDFFGEFNADVASIFSHKA